MVISAQDIALLIDEICLTMLGMATHRPGPGDPALVAGEPSLDGLISITGDWQATVALQVTTPLAMRIAAAMFHLGSTPASREDMQDAVGELTNILGGNIKALLEGECQLSLPAVIEGHAYTVSVPGAQLLTRVDFVCDGHPAAVNLVSLAAHPIQVQ